VSDLGADLRFGQFRQLVVLLVVALQLVKSGADPVRYGPHERSDELSLPMPTLDSVVPIDVLTDYETKSSIAAIVERHRSPSAYNIVRTQRLRYRKIVAIIRHVVIVIALVVYGSVTLVLYFA